MPDATRLSTTILLAGPHFWLMMAPTTVVDDYNDKLQTWQQGTFLLSLISFFSTNLRILPFLVAPHATRGRRRRSISESRSPASQIFKKRSIAHLLVKFNRIWIIHVRLNLTNELCILNERWRRTENRRERCWLWLTGGSERKYTTTCHCDKNGKWSDIKYLKLWLLYASYIKKPTIIDREWHWHGFFSSVWRACGGVGEGRPVSIGLLFPEFT